MLWFAISVKDNFVLDAQPREYLAIRGLRVLPDKSAFVGPQMPCLQRLSTMVDKVSYQPPILINNESSPAPKSPGVKVSQRGGAAIWWLITIFPIAASSNLRN